MENDQNLHWGGKLLVDCNEQKSQTDVYYPQEVVKQPNHYKLNHKNIECIQAIEAASTPEEFAGALRANVIKYIWRYNYKGNPLKDLKKARDYLNWLIEHTETGSITVPIGE